ncbi:hypothetical protein CANCADRAFT_55978 [Tortispora caseinolytica NRRL Y-17796]|uniref:Uncharacterized protein n=1 Tax=Tortispora caseinolytica NRRL Y-17796 TaxID=767744 RepID=A0A1E4TKJ5_9ASCO|nr:hypothetical protein CANCADRAFT_55978 [Tortispora caseinolytica NRRL Y-17796]
MIERRKIDEQGEKKILPNGQLIEREYCLPTFEVPSMKGTRVMLAENVTEIARAKSGDDIDLNELESKVELHVASLEDKVYMIEAGFVSPMRIEDRIVFVPARSAFKHFGHLIVAQGRPIIDDYYCEEKSNETGPVIRPVHSASDNFRNRYSLLQGTPYEPSYTPLRGLQLDEMVKNSAEYNKALLIQKSRREDLAIEFWRSAVLDNDPREFDSPGSDVALSDTSGSPQDLDD